jgi:hypothetical protein
MDKQSCTYFAGQRGPVGSAIVCNLLAGAHANLQDVLALAYADFSAWILHAD